MDVKTILKAVILTTMLAGASAGAQPVDDNDLGVFFGSYPQSGAWLAMDGSNTGFFLDIQNGVLGGAFFGFNGDGENVWLTFSGPLQRALSVNFNLDWILDTSLNQGFGGGCILDCTGAEPARTTTEVGNIRISFSGRSSATYVIDGGDPVPIVPLYFGTPAIFNNNALGLFAQPDLEGTWAVASGSLLTNTAGDTEAFSLADSAGIVEIGPLTVITRQAGENNLPLDVEMTASAPIISDPQQLFPENAFIQCIYFQQTTLPPRIPLIDCEIVSEQAEPPGLSVTRQIDIQRMSDSRFVVLVTTTSQPDDGVIHPVQRLEGFRVGYD